MLLAGLGCLWLCLVSSWGAEPKVVLHLLDHTGKAKCEKRFWIDWSEEWRGIVKSKTLSKEDSLSVVKALRTSLLKESSSNFCGHDPIYGIEAVDAAGKTLKTSLCFKCVTWVFF